MRPCDNPLLQGILSNDPMIRDLCIFAVENRWKTIGAYRWRIERSANKCGWWDAVVIGSGGGQLLRASYCNPNSAERVAIYYCHKLTRES